MEPNFSCPDAIQSAYKYMDLYKDFAAIHNPYQHIVIEKEEGNFSLETIGLLSQLVNTDAQLEPGIIKIEENFKASLNTLIEKANSQEFFAVVDCFKELYASLAFVHDDIFIHEKEDSSYAGHLLKEKYYNNLKSIIETAEKQLFSKFKPTRRIPKPQVKSLAVALPIETVKELQNMSLNQPINVFKEPQSVQIGDIPKKVATQVKKPIEMPKITKDQCLELQQKGLFSLQKHPGITVVMKNFDESVELSQELDSRQIQNLNIKFKNLDQLKESVTAKWSAFKRAEKEYNRIYQEYSSLFDRVEMASKQKQQNVSERGVPPPPGPPGAPPIFSASRQKAILPPPGLAPTLTPLKNSKAKKTLSVKWNENDLAPFRLYSTYKALQENKNAFVESYYEVCSELFFDFNKEEDKYCIDNLEMAYKAFIDDIEALQAWKIGKKKVVNLMLSKSSSLQPSQLQQASARQNILKKKESNLQTSLRALTNAEAALKSKLQNLQRSMNVSDFQAIDTCNKELFTKKTEYEKSTKEYLAELEKQKNMIVTDLKKTARQVDFQQKLIASRPSLQAETKLKELQEDLAKKEKNNAFLIENLDAKISDVKKEFKAKMKDLHVLEVNI